MKKIFSLVFIFVMLVAILGACGDKASGEGDKKVTIGAKDFTEQFLLSKITALYLEDNGFEVEEKNNMGSAVLRKALENEQVDLYWEYTGTALTTYLKEDPIGDPEKAFDKVKSIDEKKNEISWMSRSDVNNAYAIAMLVNDAEKYGITSLSDLANYINSHDGELTFASDSEFENRPDGLPGLEKAYGFEFGASNVKQLQIGLQYEALNANEVDVAMVFATDGNIKKYDLLVLEDDKQVLPAYNAAISINKSMYEKYPKLEELTADIAEKLDSGTMRELNYKVDVEEKQVEDVAKEWLKANEMLK